MPPPAQVIDEPFAGVRVPDGGVEVEAGMAIAQHEARRAIVFNFKFEGITLSGNSVERNGNKARLLPNF
jgi:hypothetical protein